VKILNIKSARLLLSILFARAAGALIRTIFLKLEGVGINDSEDRRIFSDLSHYVLC